MSWALFIDKYYVIFFFREVIKTTYFLLNDSVFLSTIALTGHIIIYYSILFSNSYFLF